MSSVGLNLDCLKVEACLLSPALGQFHRISYNLAMPGSLVFHTALWTLGSRAPTTST